MTRGSRSTITAAISTAVIVILALFALPSRATSSVKTVRIAGNDRYETAVAIAKAAFPSGATDAIVASGTRFPDALAGSYLAGVLGAPILLTPFDQLSTATRTALKDLKVQKVHVLGGPAVVSAAVEQTLRDDGYTVGRMAGDTRYDTAETVAESQGGAAVGSLGSLGRTAVVVSGVTFPDALAAGPAAYAKKLPVLLTETESLSPQAASALRNLGIKHVLILGGTGAVSAEVEGEIADMEITVQRFAGIDRADTAALFGEFAINTLKFSKARITLASGRLFADALAGAVYGGSRTSLVLLMASVPPPTRAFVKSHNSTINELDAYGGPRAITDEDLADLANTARCSGSGGTTTTTGGGILPVLAGQGGAQAAASSTTTSTTTKPSTTTTTKPSTTTTLAACSKPPTTTTTAKPATTTTKPTTTTTP